MNQAYLLTVPVWISIIQDKLSLNFNYQMFFPIIIRVMNAVIHFFNE